MPGFGTAFGARSGSSRLLCQNHDSHPSFRSKGLDHSSKEVPCQPQSCFLCQQQRTSKSVKDQINYKIEVIYQLIL